MRIAVTGATGFLGRHVVRWLTDRKADVVAMLRPDSLNGASLGNVATIEVDLEAPPVDLFDRLGRPDAVVHLAWQGLPNYNALFHFEHELPIQYRFTRQLIDGGLKCLVVAGTCFEYGMQSGALAEDMAAVPTNPYGYAKDCLRRQLEFLQRVQPFSLAWARLFYMHGEGQAPNSLLPQLEQAIARGDRVFNMSGGEQLRDYLSVLDVAGYLGRLALDDGDVGIVNICSGRPVSVRSLVEGWIAERGADIAPNLGHYPYPDYEPMAFWGDRRKLETVLASPAAAR